MQKILSHVRRCVEDFDMIAEGDSIAVGVSGGKDSLAALCALAQLSRFYPKKFEVKAISLDLGYDEMDFSPVARLCETLEVPYKVVKTDIKTIVFDIRKESNPCSLCANMRRGALNNAALELGCSKVALGHHLDDAVDTFLMSLIYEGRLSCFTPVTYLDRCGVTLLRPLLYCREFEIKALARKLELPVVKNACPADTNSKRHRVKEIAESLKLERADIYEKVFGAIQRLPLPGWETK
ncbi:MAG: tRNA 2-thiocytidine biosynthesis protein TtcA [Ruminococcaceae bacterium]|nr:tRNA 2-thiocytidine biosynthesis protein TtcA [Oscillospiraceae bacterium]